MNMVVDLNHCQGYAQCVFLAPRVFTLHGEEALLYTIADRAEPPTPVPSDVPDPTVLSHGPTVALTGHLPDRRLAVVQPAR
ncbi:ferredoxin [Streptomyces lydicus]|uniref:ferredoxin n=1 Tax=Streptomyces lydicus TaxID=47763 RepID=UPI00343394CE